MHITIIGASSGVGLLALQQALTRGHQVTALARNMAAVPDHPRLTKLNGSATVAADVRQALLGAEAVLLTIGSKDKSLTTLYTDATQALLTVAPEVGFTGPVLAITGFGIGESRPYLNLLMGFVVKVVLRKQSADKARLETLLAQSPLPWEIVRPGILSNGPLTRRYQVLTSLYKGMKVGKISRANVADFMLNEAESPTLLYQRPALTV